MRPRKVHWLIGIYYAGEYHSTACDLFGRKAKATSDPDKVTCKHQACVKAAREAKERSK